MASLVVRMPPAGLTPTCRPVAARKSRTASSMTSVTGSVAAGCDLAGRGLDEVGAGEHAEPGGPAHVVVGDELAGLQDDLEVRVAAGLLDGDDLVEHLEVAAGQEGAAVDHHVDLVGAGGDRVPRVGELDLEAGPAARERGGDAARRARRCRAAPRPPPAPCPGRRRSRRPGGCRGPPGRAAGPWRTARAPCPGCPRPPAWSGRSSGSPGRSPTPWPWS